MNRPVSIIGLIVAFTVVGFGWYFMNRIPDNRYPEIKLAFTLHSSDGPVSFSDTRGKVGLLFFGYAHCPDICPATMVNFGQVLDLLSESERSKVKALFISVDPSRDTPEIMKKYVGFFHPDIIGLTGSAEEVEAAAKSFMVAVEKEEPNELGNYSVAHSSYVFITRPDGGLGALIGHQDSVEEIAEQLRYWMKWAD
ncbi:MAG: SCO family protein [Mariprofundaceae bacterium]|nr:SCO family protein [Mariprofundaceae bacterium]